MSPSGPTETTSDFSSTEPSTTTNTVPGSMNKTTTQMGSTEMTTDPTEMTTDPTEMTNSTHITPPTTATTPETTTGCTLLCDAGTGLSVGIIIGIVFGCLALLAILLAVCVAACRYHKKTNVSPETDQNKKGKDKKVNGKADDKAAGVADV
ncbi:integumentary mucin A.1-like [Asterias rubens]|uniref:integumentary mucin A.1-like n=1 Tax=Asterias rubens TaxID=7604 RepID=UPI001454F931|nr:integumentary mucin A.1-like [Asterias rubens]